MTVPDQPAITAAAVRAFFDGIPIDDRVIVLGEDQVRAGLAAAAPLIAAQALDVYRPAVLAEVIDTLAEIVGVSAKNVHPDEVLRLTWQQILDLFDGRPGSSPATRTEQPKPLADSPFEEPTGERCPDCRDPWAWHQNGRCAGDFLSCRCTNPDPGSCCDGVQACAQCGPRL